MRGPRPDRSPKHQATNRSRAPTTDNSLNQPRDWVRLLITDRFAATAAQRFSPLIRLNRGARRSTERLDAVCRVGMRERLGFLSVFKSKPCPYQRCATLKDRAMFLSKGGRPMQRQVIRLTRQELYQKMWSTRRRTPSEFQSSRQG
jgi:hypothetical protein